MKPMRSTVRNSRGWIGLTAAALVVIAGAAVGAQASPSGSGPAKAGSAAATGSSSADDPHEAAAQREADRILTTFQPPPGATKAARRPDPVPSGLQGPPQQSAALTQAISIAWYSTSQTPDQVLAWVQAHRPAGSSWSGSGSGSQGPSFEIFSYATPGSSLIVTPQSGSDGRTVIRLDASVIWTPSRPAGSRLGHDAPSVSVITVNTLNPHNSLPASETRTLTATAPVVVHNVVDLLNNLQPQIPDIRNCAMDDGTRVRITLPGLATVIADPGGCGAVTVTPQGGPRQVYAGGGDLVTKVYALYGVIWSRTGDLPQGIERTGASGTP
jgi:hypothetical protein